MIFTADDIRSRLRGRPFTPLRLVTTTKELYDIYHPDLIWVTSRFLEIGTPSVNDPTLADAVTRVALAHVTEMRDLPMPVAPAPESSAA